MLRTTRTVAERKARPAARAAGVAALALAGAMAAAPAHATIRTGEINCSSTTLLGPIAIRNPSTSHVTGPVWAAQGAAVQVTTKAGVTVLPRNVGPATVGSYQDLVNKSQIVGQATTTMTPGAIPGLVFLYDPDLADAVPPVPMDGVTTYIHALDGVLGPFPAPTVVVSGPLPLVGTPGTFDVTTTLDPGAGSLPTGSTPMNPGAAIIAPDVVMNITNTGSTDGSIEVIATSTTLTANVTAPLVTSAVTSCAPSAEPTHVINVQTDGGPIVDDAPVFACKPTLGTPGAMSDSKGWWSNPASLESEFGGSMKGDVTYGGCVAPDQKLDAWVTAKTGALAAEATGVSSAAIKFKGKHFGNCTDVALRSPEGLSYGADTDTAYPIYGSLQAKFNVSKPKGPQAAIGGNIVVDTTGPAPRAYFEASGTVSKGTGVGGTLYFLAELDGADPDVAGIIACNSPGYIAPADVFYGKTVLPIVTGDDAVLSVSLP